MNFKAQTERDLTEVFHNSTEHADIVEFWISGTRYKGPVILDDGGAQDRKKPSTDHVDGLVLVDLVMQGFLSPSKDMTASLEKLGYANGKALLESKGLQGALDALRQSVGGDELAFAKLFSSVEAQTAVLALAGEQADNFKSKTAEMYSASGAAATAFATATDNAESKMQKAKNAIANLGIVLGDTFLPYVTTAAEKLSGLVTKFSEWAQENPELLSTIVKVAAALAGLKVGALAGKLGFLEVKGGVLAVQGAFTKLKAFAGTGGGIKSLFSGLGGIGGKLLPIVGIP